MPINILVTGANSTVSQSIMKALRGSSLDVRIVGCDINPYAPGLYRADEAFLVERYDAPDYEEQMLALMRRQRIDLMLPAVESELQTLASRREHWERETGATIVVNSRELLDITQDKYATARFLAENGCSAPASIVPSDAAALRAFVERVGFPLVVKPRRGATSRHVYVVRNMEELYAKLAIVPGPVVQEHLGSADEEYTCGLFVDAAGELKGIATLKRTMLNGITGCAVVDRFPDVEAEAARIARVLKPRGSCNIQMRRNREGRPTTFEINARFSSSVAIRAHFGFNEAEATVRSFLLGEAIPPMRCRRGVAMRYINEVYAEGHEVQALMSCRSHTPRASVVEANF